MDNLVPIFGMMFAGFWFYLQYKERMEKIEKGLVDSAEIKPALSGGPALIVGMIITALGISGMVGAVLIKLADYSENAPFIMLIWFMPVLFIGCTLLLYYRMTAPLRSSEKKAFELLLEAKQQEIEARRQAVDEEVIDETDLNV